MTAPFFWIFLPMILGIFLMVFRNQKVLALISGFFCFFLALAAFLLPINETITLRSISFTLDPTQQILGRSLNLVNSDRSWLVLIFTSAAVWFMASSTIFISRSFVPLGLLITGLLTASLAVEPFLYAILLIEAAVLLSIPLLSPPGKTPGRGVLRFLIYQTLAVPFILVAGWLLAGLDANPGDVNLVILSVVILGLGFALLLAIFPFYSWLPTLAGETHPYVAGFILWSFPTIGIFFGASFLDRYAWLRETGAIGNILVTVGVLMVVMAGLFALLQRHLGRLMGYAVMFQNGFSFICLGLGGSIMDLFLLLFLPRLVGLALWALTITNLHKYSPTLLITDIGKIAKAWSFSSLGLVVAGFSLAGLPVLASFPFHSSIWEELARQSVSSVIWVILGSCGLIIASIRVILAIVSNPGIEKWGANETILQRIFITLAMVFILVMGIFPASLSAFWQRLPALFTHLGQ